MPLIDVLHSPKFKKDMEMLIDEHTDSVMQDCYKMCVSIEGKNGRCAQAIKHMQKMKRGELGITVKVAYDGGGKGVSVKSFEVPADFVEVLTEDSNDSEEMILRYIDETYNPFPKSLKNANAEIKEIGFV